MNVKAIIPFIPKTGGKAKNSHFNPFFNSSKLRNLLVSVIFRIDVHY